MEEVSVAPRLVVIELCTETYMSFGFGEIIVEPANPLWLVAIQVLVQLVEDAEVRARRAAYNKKWFISMHDVPSTRSVRRSVKVEPIRED